MEILGYILLIVGGIFAFIVGISYLFTCFRCSPSYTLLSFVPLIGIFFSFALLIKFWHELKDLFFAGIIANIVVFAGAFMVGLGSIPVDNGSSAPDIAQQMRQEADRRNDEMMQRMQQDRERQRQHMDRQREQMRSLHNNIFGERSSSQGSSYTPPPPDEPIFEDGTLVKGMSMPGADLLDWMDFVSPDVGESLVKTVDMHGYELTVPDVYRVLDAQPIEQGRGMQWRIIGGQHDNGSPVQIKVSLTPLPQQTDGQVIEPSWSEVLGRANVSRSGYSVEYGLVGGIRFARCADKLVRSGHGIGKVRYLGQPSPENPQQIEIEFATNPAGYGRSHALMCEAIVRSMKRVGRVMMPATADAQVTPAELVSDPAAGLPSPEWQVRGPFAFAVSEQAGVSFSAWARDGSAWTTSVRFQNGRDAGIEIRLQPDREIPEDRVRPIALQGPVRFDAVACAFGGDAQYVQLWDGARYARIEHTPQPRESGGSNRRVTYHGYLNDYRVDIAVTNSDDSEMTLGQVLDTLLRSRLATAPELIANPSQAEWLRDVLGPDRPAFVVANGVDATRALLLDERGQVTLSPQYDIGNQRMFEVFPTLANAETLGDYERWAGPETVDEDLLGKPESIDELEIRPIKELRAAHNGRELSWQARTKAGNVGMTVYVEPLRATEQDIETPLIETSNRLRFRLGRRILQPSMTPDVTYRELRNLRIWRINVPANARQEIARCHYLAIVPGKMIVISASYIADKPEQLEAFDASVATLVYKDGEVLKPAPSAQ